MITSLVNLSITADQTFQVLGVTEPPSEVVMGSDDLVCQDQLSVQCLRCSVEGGNDGPDSDTNSCLLARIIEEGHENMHTGLSPELSL